MRKLIRDHIPNINPKDITTVDPELMPRLLADKLVEEAREFRAEPSIEELADVWEVFRSICRWTHIPMEDVFARADMKRINRGGFENCVVLKHVNDDCLGHECPKAHDGCGRHIP